MGPLRSPRTKSGVATSPADRGEDPGGGFYRIVGITYSAPARMPAGQRAVTVLSRV
jgi:hypothetical protein